MDTVLIGTAAIPIIVAIVAAIRGAFPDLPNRLAPILSIVVGIAWSTITVAGGLGDGAEDMNVAQAAIFGVVYGLAASGLYSGAVKPTAKALTE